jgi:hypothetical protein
MRTSIAIAATLAAAAGASTVAAVTNGNHLALNGSDTLFDVTNDVITACGLQFSGTTYPGGGSTGGALKMQLGAQEIAPMSRALRYEEMCDVQAGYTANYAANLLIGLDGISIVTSKSSSCSTTTVNQVGRSFGYGSGGTYVLGMNGVPASLDALRILFMGIDSGLLIVGCDTDLREALIRNWTNLFSTDPTCGGGDAHCTSGITHAWRLADISGSTDAFVDILLATNGGGLALPRKLSSMQGATQANNPFCNSFERNDSNHQPQYLDGTGTLNDGHTTPLSDGRVNDQSDHDPIRTPCDDNDTLCGATWRCYGQPDAASCAAASSSCEWVTNLNPNQCVSKKDMGVVLPIFLPDVPYLSSELYPTKECTGTCTLLPVIAGVALPTGYKCPNGADPIAARCYHPVASDGDPRCVVKDSTPRCFGTPKPTGPKAVDFRVYNQSTVVQSSEINPAAYRFGGATYQVALDSNHRLLNGSFYRQHMLAPSSYNNRPWCGQNTTEAACTAVAGCTWDATQFACNGQISGSPYTGTCLQHDSTSQIGCLVDADDCSVAYGGLGAARTYPGGVLDANKALLVDGNSPFGPGAITTLVTGTAPYELARRLYLATGPAGVGFANLPANSSEQTLAQCFSQDSLVGPAMTAHGYVPVPSEVGGIQCLDYDERKLAAQPLVNTPSVGGNQARAMPGCFCIGAAPSDDYPPCRSATTTAQCSGWFYCSVVATNTNACLNVDNAHGFRFGQ